MNKFLTFQGEQPVYLGDVDFMQEAVRQSFLQLLVGLTGQSDPSCILKMATSQEDGVICLHGEIMPYKAYTGTMAGLYSYTVVSSYSGSRVFKNGETHQCHEVRYAQESVSLVGENMPTLDELLQARIAVKKFTEIAQTGVFFKHTVLGNIDTVEVSVEFPDDVTTENLLEGALVSFLSRQSVAQSPIYCNCVCETNGVFTDGILRNIPAKVILSADETTGAVSMTVNVNSTTFVSGTVASLRFSVLIK